MAAAAPSVEIEVGDRTIRLTNPDRVYFPETGQTKRDLLAYYLAVGDGIVRALRERPCMLHRFSMLGDLRAPRRRRLQPRTAAGAGRS